MARWQRVALVALAAWFGPFQCTAQCGFAIVPAADKNWHRNEGWPIPGLSDAKGFAKIHRTINDKPADWVWPEGISVAWVTHDKVTTFNFPMRSSKKMACGRGCSHDVSYSTQCCVGK